MTLFRNVVFVAALSGLLAGLVLAALQSFATVPLIIEAEAFEDAGAAVQDHGDDPSGAAAASAHEHAPGVAPHDHGEDAWAPSDGFARFAFSGAVNVVTGIGFALLLVVASEMAGGMAGWRQGLMWGLAGFGVFTLAPGLGLPPELPAMPAADLLDRQTWWLATVIATATGLALIAFKGGLTWSLAGLALIAAPHLFGAPQPPTGDSLIPAGLHRQFMIAATLTSLIFWTVLGAVAGAARRRFVGAASGLSGSLA
jgi:cobalt transporter subunit CbtA